MEKDVLTGEPSEEIQEVDQTADAQEPAGEQSHEGDGAGSPAEPGTEKLVPFKAYDAERKGRQDWKEKATRAEERLRVYEEQQQRAQPSEPVDPIQSMQQQIVNERFNTSEMIAKSKYPDLDEKVEIFMEAAAANPLLKAQLLQQPNPYEFVYKEASRIALQRELGDDPAAYKARVEAELREKILAEMGQPAPLRVPTSLAGTRSSATRSAAAFTGPTPFDQILK